MIYFHFNYLFINIYFIIYSYIYNLYNSKTISPFIHLDGMLWHMCKSVS